MLRFHEKYEIIIIHIHTQAYACIYKITYKHVWSIPVCVFQEIFNTSNLIEKGIRNDVEFINYLRFADAIELLASSF